MRAHWHSGLALLIATVLMLTSVGSVAAQDGAPRWNLQKGQAFDLVVQQDIRQIVRMHGLADQEIPMTQRSDSTWTVTEATADDFTIEQVMSRMQMSVRSPMMRLAFDSDEANPTDSASRQMKDAISKVIGQKIVVRMTRRGEVVSVTLPDGFRNAPASPANPFSADTLRQMVQQASVAFPDGALTTGTTWDHTVDMGMNGMQMKAKTVYTYDGLHDVDGTPTHRITSRVEMTMNGGMMGLPMALRKQENTGTLLFNAKDGRLTSVKARTNLTMEMDAGGQRVEQDMVGDTTITLTPRVP